MSDVFLQRIRELEDKLNKCDTLLKSFRGKIKDLTNNTEEIKVRDQELKELRSQLTTHSHERDNIQKELDDKVKELENSNLSNLEKQKQINQILVDNRNELNSVNQSLMTSWTNYNIQRDKMLDHLVKTCSTCEIKDKEIVDLIQVRNWLFGTVFLLLILLLLSFLFGYCSPKKPTKNKKIISI